MKIHNYDPRCASCLALRRKVMKDKAFEILLWAIHTGPKPIKAPDQQRIKRPAKQRRRGKA